MGFLQRIKNLFSSAADAAGETVGIAENVAQRPFYPITSYVAIVRPGILWRGSWPSTEDLIKLKQKIGIKTIVNLCSERDQEAAVIAAGMKSIPIPILDNECPNQIQVDLFISAVRIMAPVYVHCEMGAGRTGCMVAAYRVLEQKWPVLDALSEARRYGLAMPSQRQWILNLGK